MSRGLLNNKQVEAVKETPTWSSHLDTSEHRYWKANLNGQEMTYCAFLFMSRRSEDEAWPDIEKSVFSVCEARGDSELTSRHSGTESGVPDYFCSKRLAEQMVFLTRLHLHSYVLLLPKPLTIYSPCLSVMHLLMYTSCEDIHFGRRRCHYWKHFWNSFSAILFLIVVTCC